MKKGIKDMDIQAICTLVLVRNYADEKLTFLKGAWHLKG